MFKLTEEETKNVYGGGVLMKVVMGFVTAGSFIVGLIDGYLRPLKCKR